MAIYLDEHCSTNCQFFLCHLEIKMAACNTKFLDRALWEMEKIFFGSRNLIDPKVT